MNINSQFGFVQEAVSKYAPKVGAFVNDNVYGVTMTAPLGKDTAVFSKSLAKLFERKEGFACTYFDFKKEKEILEKLPVFRNKNTFGIEEYKNLTSQEREYLDRLSNEVYVVRKPYYFATQEMQRTVNDDADFLIKIADEAKKSLDEKFPQGYKFIGIGGSPSIFSKIYEYEGVGTKNIPYNWHAAGADFDYVSYFAKLGLNEKTLKDSKEKILFVDFVKTGKTFDNLKETLNKHNLVNKENTAFVSFMELLDRKIPFADYSTMKDYYFESEAIKSFCPCPDMGSVESWRNVDKMKEAFNWSNSTKLMNYVLLKKLDQTGRLNV